LDFLCTRLSLKSERVFRSSAPLDLSFCYSLDRALDRETHRQLCWPAHVPAEAIPVDKNLDMMKLARERDIFLSYPFDSITPLLALVGQAAEDPSVASIKITLYRIDVQSQLATWLIRAAENGKEVVALMELRARFDESNNIEWAQRLEDAGCRVIYGLQGYKVHSKVCLISRNDHGRIQHITQIGTGNYNEKTARLYTDLSLITANQEIGRDAVSFFSNLLLGNLEGQYMRLWVAPMSLKSNILREIELERQKATRGENGRIIIKCNSITDKEIIEKLAEASQAGVRISMIVRGICCLVPRVPGSTENITVISIVGKFLEHSRIFCFGMGEERKIYIASADFMTRNTERRVEVACPILDPGIKNRIYDMLEVLLADNTQAWEQFADGSYIPRQPSPDLRINSQERFTQEARANAMKAGLDRGKAKKKSRLPLLERARRAARALFGK
jgi:polyphosphate kinase